MWGNRFLFSVLFFVSSCQSLQPIPTIDPRSGSVLGDRQYLYAGIPEVTSYPNPLVTLRNKGYIAGYDNARGVPAWVAYRLFKVGGQTSGKRPSRFKIDKRVKTRIAHDVYKRSGFDRGHMAPNFAIATRYGREAQLETFLMTNIVPQTASLNRAWWKNLEKMIAVDFSRSYDQVWVITGPVFDEKDNWLKESVKVPVCYYKIVKAKVDGKLEILAFMVPQDISLPEHAPYLVSVRQIEERTGINFDPAFDAYEGSLENSTAQRLWLQPEPAKPAERFVNKCLNN